MGLTIAERIVNLEKLYSKGKMSPKLKTAVKNMISALKKHNRTKMQEIGWIHQEITGDMEQKYSKSEYREDDDWNNKIAGTTVYREFDLIWHGVY